MRQRAGEDVWPCNATAAVEKVWPCNATAEAESTKTYFYFTNPRSQSYLVAVFFNTIVTSSSQVDRWIDGGH